MDQLTSTLTAGGPLIGAQSVPLGGNDRTRRTTVRGHPMLRDVTLSAGECEPAMAPLHQQVTVLTHGLEARGVAVNPDLYC